jgi:signal transduction histidine kinase
VLLLLGTAASASAETSSVTRVTRAEVVTQSHGSFGMPSAVPELDVRASAWQGVTLPYAIPRAVVSSGPDEIVTTWFRLPQDLLRSVPPRSALYVPRWQSIGKIAVYVNGQLVERSRGGAVWNGYNHPLWIVSRPDDPPLSEVLIRLDHLRSAGGALSSVWVGHEPTLRHARFLREFFQAKVPEIVTTTLLILGLFSFAVWVWRRRETAYLLFSGLSALAYIRCLHYYVGLDPLLISESGFGWLTVNSAGWLALVTYFLAFRLHRQRYPRFERWLTGILAAASLLTLPAGGLIPDVGPHTALAYLLIFGTVIVLSVAMCLASWRSRSVEGLLFSGWNLLNIPLIAHDWMLQNYLLDIEGVYLMPYTVLGTSIIFMAIILRRYLQALENMESANARLEARLGEREAQLTATHEQLRLAERQQVLNDERQRLIRDMHDGFGSSLIGALIAVENAPRDRLDIARILRECIDDMKLTIDSLEPTEADLPLLLGSLRYRMGPRLEAVGIALEWNVVEDARLGWLTPGSSLQILRMLQEIFTNVIKHAQASAIGVHMRSNAQSVTVVIEDNGKGFAVEQASVGRGLANLKSRARSLRAEVRWASQPGCTRFELTLPANVPTCSDATRAL